MKGQMFETTFNGVTLVGDGGSLDYVKYGLHGQINGIWTEYIANPEKFYGPVSFIVYDNQNEQYQCVHAKTKEDLAKVWEVLHTENPNFNIETNTMACGKAMLEHIMALPDFS